MGKYFKILTYLILSFSIFSPSYSQPPGWEIVDINDSLHNSSYKSYYNDIKCADSLNCIMWCNFGGAGGIYFRGTTDGGNTWKNLYKDSSWTAWVGSHVDSFYYANKIKSIAYPNKKLFIAVGDSGMVIRTSDQGETWGRISLGKDKSLSQIRMFDENYGMMSRYHYGEDTVSLLQTIDGGLTWDQMNVPSDGKGPLIGFSDIDIIRRDLFAASIWYMRPVPKRYLLMVHGNWEKWDTLPIPPNIFHIDFIDENNGWGSGGLTNWDSLEKTTQEIHKTTDGGKSWIEQRDTITGDGYRCQNITFFGDKFGFATSCYTLNLMTTDGGNKWQEIFMEPVNPFSGLFYCTFAVQVPSATSAFIIYSGSTQRDHVYKYTRTLTDVHEERPPGSSPSISSYPNPFASEAEITIYLGKPGSAKLTLCDMLGNEQTLLNNESLSQGEHKIQLSSSGLSSGLYLLRLESGGEYISKKIVILK